jgi:hypothetical protein
LSDAFPSLRCTSSEENSELYMQAARMVSVSFQTTYGLFRDLNVATSIEGFWIFLLGKIV